MSDKLETPLAHRVITSPLGRLFHSRLFERFKIASVDTEFRVLRARAAADLAGEDVDAFLNELGVTDPIDDSLAEQIVKALASHSGAKAEYERIAAEWDDLFWGDSESTVDERTRLEKQRREAGSRWISPQQTFKFLAKTELVEIVDFDVPDPASTLDRWAAVGEADVYSPPDTRPEVEVSRTMRGPGTREYLVRFPSPSAYVDDAAYARVYEPVDCPEDESLPTLVFCTGLAMACDAIEYWTEEEYVGRSIAPRGYRVVLPIPPWHGRREIPGSYTGEPYLARMPESAIELYSTQAAEIAVLTDWARSLGAPTVGVGGISLGGIVTTLVASHADAWPTEWRPDFAVPVAPSARVDDLLFDSSLTEILGVTDALQAAGWTPESMDELGHLLRAPDSAGIDPERIYPVGGLRDEMTQYRPTKAVFQKWGVPASNFTEWDCGHFGVLLRVMRTQEFQNLLTTILDAPQQSVGLEPRRSI
jgi:pimeloyl-ACP methyl ester carboxylesterase